MNLSINEQQESYESSIKWTGLGQLYTVPS